MENGAFIGTGVAIASITEGFKLGMIGRKGLPNSLRCLFEHYHHKCAHQVGCVDILVVLGGAVVEQLYVFVAFVRKQSTKFADIFVGICQVERPEIRVERLINQLVVHIVEVSF